MVPETEAAGLKEPCKFAEKPVISLKLHFSRWRGAQDAPIRGIYAGYRPQLAASRGSRGCASPQELRVAALSRAEPSSPSDQGEVDQVVLADSHRHHLSPVSL